MIHLQNVSAQRVSWVKSNKEALEKHADAIKNLYYPENIDELTELVKNFYKNNIKFDIIGYSSNTLFLPTYSIDHLICTKKLDNWVETTDTIVCDCGVNVAKLAKGMVRKGYKGFYGLVDIPGTIASGVYGNCGCYNCLVCDLLVSFTLLTKEGSIRTLHVGDLKLKNRSTALKRHEIGGIILQVVLKKTKGTASIEISKAAKVHNERRATQPNAANNLGTTFLGDIKTLKMKAIILTTKIIRVLTLQSHSKSLKFALSLFGGSKYVKYLFFINRYMFYDAESHKLFPKYIRFMKTLYKDSHLEIEIRK